MRSAGEEKQMVASESHSSDVAYSRTLVYTQAIDT